MSALKGFDRIALVIAIIAIVPGFYLGYTVHQDKAITMTPEYKAWSEDVYEKRVNKGLDEYDFESYDLIEPASIEKWNYPSTLKSSMWGLLSSLVSFFVIFLSICGTTRLLSWIIEGFRGDSANGG